MPLNVLLFHVAELTLKAMLKTVKIKPQHHRLADLRSTALQHGLPIAENFSRFIDAHSPARQVETFRYGLGEQGEGGYKMIGYVTSLKILREQLDIATPIVLAAIGRMEGRGV